MLSRTRITPTRRCRRASNGIRKGLYLSAGSGGEKAKLRVQLLGSGTILREVIAAADLLEADFGVSADIWAMPSFTELRREAVDVERWNMLHPEAAAWCGGAVGHCPGPFVAATDYVRTFPDQIRPYISGRYVTLGTEGYGRSDTRAKLRKFFEVNRWYVAVAALKALADEGPFHLAGHGSHPQVRDRSRKAQPGQGIKAIVVQLECLPRCHYRACPAIHGPRDKPRVTTVWFQWA